MAATPTSSLRATTSISSTVRNTRRKLVRPRAAAHKPTRIMPQAPSSISTPWLPMQPARRTSTSRVRLPLLPTMASSRLSLAMLPSISPTTVPTKAPSTCSAPSIWATASGRLATHRSRWATTSSSAVRWSTTKATHPRLRPTRATSTRSTARPATAARAVPTWARRIVLSPWPRPSRSSTAWPTTRPLRVLPT